MVSATQTNVAGTGAVSIVPASGTTGDAPRHIKPITVTTANIVAGTLTLSDGAKTVAVFNYPNAASAPGTILQAGPFPSTKTNAAWTLQASANASGYNVT